jgi:hypothetical protein
MKGCLPQAATGAAFALMFMLIIKIWADTPIVYKSWETQECVRVDDPAREHDCGNLPDKYEMVWVK